ncbi:MAG: DUF2126 domain-containing protein [Burkholderiaceae bacterium]
MSIHVALNHVTHYEYDRPVALSPQIVRLRPAAHSRTRILSYSLTVEPTAHFINWQQDPQNNYLARLAFPEKTRELKVTVDLVAEMAVFNPFDFFLEPAAEQFPFTYDAETAVELAPFLAQTIPTPAFQQYLNGISLEPQPTIDFLVGINQRLYQDIRYLIRMEPGVQTPEETLTSAAGSCRDSAWLLVQILRHLGLAARFVSGYLIQLAQDVESLDGPSGPPKDFTDLHAWCEVYLPGAGWIGLDATSGLLAGEGHIPLACSPEPSSAAPISGVVEHSEVKFHHQMTVRRIYESPRMTKPYTETQWQAIVALGDRVDADLQAQDVRLTMGGEPTFVADGNRQALEWNTDAMGPTKRGLALDLMQHMRAKYGAGGFLHMGQGKWYPGEQLPRWALSLYWRADGQAAWSDPGLLAGAVRSAAQPVATAADAERFVRSLTDRLQITAAGIVAAYEDTFHYLWRERRLPVNVDALNSKLNDPAEREKLAEVFTQGLDTVVGYTLPLGFDQQKKQWYTGRWHFRGGRLLLIPGQSPLGYRMPLDSLPWVADTDYPYLHERDPLDPAVDQCLPEAPRRPAQAERADSSTIIAAEPATIPRTALCVEPRNGVLHVFLPPLEGVEHFLALLNAVEATAAEHKQTVVLEGYPPPRDPRLVLLQITPDPGVLEVNVQPVADWRSLIANTEFLYEAARQTRLSTEKFMVDGRHTGTGGGNHIVMGGAKAADSPFLRRPDLLASLLRFWINHPSLSYLFSGLFIGPTSQAPRIDEARNDQLYELELALLELKRQQAEKNTVEPWLVDRLFRNLLIDVTGNTHRAEFCIDKLYSPDGPTGRLGLLEMRAFEMPPHARMSLTQQLLLRALITIFWRTPYEAKLIRWDTELHDRFLLPSFIDADFNDVLDHLATHGHPLERAWFDPHFEFRFPLVGDLTTANGLHLTLRNALEPWHVMGEEGAIGGTTRYVDSSLERLEVKVTGYQDERYRILCNGQTVPLHPTGRVGEFVAGVRYRAWQPTSALHPTIAVDTPLRFDVVDTWNAHSVAGCQYHVAHPGGRSYDVYPVNGFEAESRRLARFFRMGHQPGHCEAPPVVRNAEYPLTLDLRFFPKTR